MSFCDRIDKKLSVFKILTKDQSEYRAQSLHKKMDVYKIRCRVTKARENMCSNIDVKCQERKTHSYSTTVHHSKLLKTELPEGEVR